MNIADVTQSQIILAIADTPKHIAVKELREMLDDEVNATEEFVRRSSRPPQQSHLVRRGVGQFFELYETFCSAGENRTLEDFYDSCVDLANKSRGIKG